MSSVWGRRQLLLRLIACSIAMSRFTPSRPRIRTFVRGYHYGARTDQLCHIHTLARADHGDGVCSRRIVHSVVPIRLCDSCHGFADGMSVLSGLRAPRQRFASRDPINQSSQSARSCPRGALVVEFRDAAIRSIFTESKRHWSP